MTRVYISYEDHALDELSLEEAQEFSEIMVQEGTIGDRLRSPGTTVRIERDPEPAA